MAELGDIITSKVRIKILELFFSNLEEMYHVRGIVREIKEETNLDVEIIKLIGWKETSCPKASDDAFKLSVRLPSTRGKQYESDRVVLHWRLNSG